MTANSPERGTRFDPILEAEKFTDEIFRRADEIEQARHLPQDLAERFARAGLYRTTIPQCYGGLELPPSDLLRLIERLARADASAAWCVFIGATSGMVTAFLPEASARAMLANPDVIMGGVFAPRGKAVRATRDGMAGYKVSGRWQWGSGAQNADWVMGGAMIAGPDGAPEMLADGKPNNRMMIFAREDVHMLDTWNVSGLCGTGSTDFEVRDLFVPHERSVDLVHDTPLERPLYAFPTFGLLAISIAGVAMGLARAAIDELVALASDKTPQGSLKPLALHPGTHSAVSEAEALLRSSRAFLYQAVEAAWADAQSGGVIAVDLRRDIRLATTHATQACARAVDLMYTLAGGTSVYRTSRLQRYFRDVHVATQHMMVSASTLELTGRLFLGVRTDTSLL